MTKRSKMTCAAALCCATLLYPVVARAQATDQDKTFLTNASQADYNEITFSQLAMKMAADPQVKKFAEKMVADHAMLEEKMKPYAMKWGLTPASSLDAEHQEKYDKLKAMSGADFDKEYMMDMEMGHQKALDMFNAEVSSTTDMKFKKTVAGGQKVVSEHKMMADKTGTKVGAAPMAM